MAIVVLLLGGLGLFLYGMKLMSDGLEKAAGAKMRKVLEVMTKNRFVGVIVGALVTAVIQSSSATTVMVVSFVNAKLMSLVQAVGVIMGANIGTTITSQLVSLDLSKIAPAFLFLGVVMVMFCKNQMVKKIGEVVLGFGILFMGLNVMSSSMESLRESPVIVDVLSGLRNPFLAIFVGFIVTAIIQSSSVTVSIVLLMATQGLLVLPICFYIILGCNMGSCVSALLASLSGKKDAKRAALIHFIFNVIGSAVIVIILLLGIDYVELLIHKISGDNIGRCVANAHTMFKVFQVVILFPFGNHLVKIVNWIVPGKDKEEEGNELKYIGKNGVYSPTVAMVETMHELEGMGALAKENLGLAIQAFFEQDNNKLKTVYEKENNIDYLCKEISDYLMKINQDENLPMQDTIQIGRLFKVVGDIERIGDHAENIADMTKTFMEDKLELTTKGQKELQDMYDKVDEIVGLAMEMCISGKKDHLEAIIILENEIDEMERQLHKSHIRRMSKGKCSAEAGIIFTDIVTGLERVADHATNIAYSILDEEPNEDLEA